MSRIGKQIITVPEKTEVTVEGNIVRVKGPGGQLMRTLPSGVSLIMLEKTIELKLGDPEKVALWGTSTAHIKNMIAGVNKPFSKQLIIEGIGYRAEVSGTTLTLALGFSHPVKIPIPEGLKVSIEKGTMTISGIDREAVGQFAAKVRALKKPEPYKGKGIRYSDEVIRRKEGKRATATA